MRRKHTLIVAGAVLGAAGLWTASWFWFAARIETNLERFIEARQEAGVAFAWDPIEITGFPLRFDMLLRNPTGRWEYEARTIEWDGADVRFRMFADEPEQATYQAPGHHEVRIVQADTVQRFDLEFARLRGLAALRGGKRGRRFAMEFGEARVTEESIGGALTVESGTIEWTRETGDGGDPGALYPQGVRQSLAWNLSKIGVPRGMVAPAARKALGESVSRFAMDLRLRGDLQPGGISPETMAAWRDAGGTIEVAAVEVVWGPLAVTGNGTLALDDELQPEGAFSATVAGLTELVDALQQAGSIAPRDAAVARISFAVLTRSQANGGPPAAEIPVSIQNRVLSLGPVPLLRLPKIAWE